MGKDIIEFKSVGFKVKATPRQSVIDYIKEMKEWQERSAKSTRKIGGCPAPEFLVKEKQG